VGILGGNCSYREDYANILHHYPNFKLEDKVDFKEEGIVRKLPAMTKEEKIANKAF